MFYSVLRVAAAAGLIQASLAHVVVREDSAAVADVALVAGPGSGPVGPPTPPGPPAPPGPKDPKLNWADVKPLIPSVINGKKFGCKCYPGQSCWPSQSAWSKLNQTVGGGLVVHIPPAAACHNTFQGPLGTVQTYDAAGCANVQANWASEQWTAEHPGANMWTYGTNDTCRPTTNPSDPCTLGYYGVYALKATTREHIKAGIDFARKNNIRLVVRNTGHDFLGRSTGWGSLILNTHSFQNVDWISQYKGPGSYRGGAVKIGAGVQARKLLTTGHAMNPPTMLVTGECPTVGLAGGFVQGGGHGPWSPLKGFSADNVLAFEAVTASGEFVKADERENPDLYWALKGGGPSAFAVILSVTMKTFPDLPAAGAVLDINWLHSVDQDVFWNGTSIFHKWSNHFVDAGLYVYFELFPNNLHIRPFVAINQTAAQLQATLQPFLDELNAAGVPHDFSISSYPTFFELYTALFEDEGAGSSAVTGGWMLNHDDVANRNDEIIDAYKTIINARPDGYSFMIGHLFNPGYGAPVSNSATHPAWRNATNFMITNIAVPEGASLALKRSLQDTLTNKIDQALRDVSKSGCTYVNEADPYQKNWQSHFWGAEYPRLKQLRGKWDPKGVFYAISTPGTEGWEVVEDGTRLCKAV